VTVTDIHKQSRNNSITDIELIRKIALTLKKGGRYNHFASTVRLKKSIGWNRVTLGKTGITD
jgi:hypothetical protein